MTTGQAVANVLDETIQALAVLDFDSLQRLEERAMTLASASGSIADEATVYSIQAKRRVLEQLLRHSESNLSALCRLHERNARGAWER